jgi:chromosome segregation ATPase
MEENCEKLEKSIESIKEEKEAKRQLVVNLELQINDQMDKISRADKNLRKILKEIQNKCICVSNETILIQEVFIQKLHINFICVRVIVALVFVIMAILS